MASTSTWGGSDRGYDMSLWYDSRPLKIGWFTMLAAWEPRSCFSASLVSPTAWTR